MWTAAFLLLKKIPYQLWLLIGGLAALYLTGLWLYESGQQSVQAKWDASVERGRSIVEDLELRANTVTTVVEEKIVKEIEIVYRNGATIVKEVPKYIPVDTPDLPAGFRVLHDAAARSQVPTETNLPGEPVSVRDATTTITVNYQTCLVWKRQLDGWEHWYEEQSLAWQTAVHK